MPSIGYADARTKLFNPIKARLTRPFG